MRPVPPRRLFWRGLLLVPFLLLPYLALTEDIDVPFAAVFMVPAWAITFATSFIHEAGHTVTCWLFGYPSLPVVKPDLSGAFTYFGARSFPLLFTVHLCFIGAAACFWHEKRFRAAKVTLALGLLHALLAYTELYKAAILLMGQGAEVAAGLGLVWVSLFRGKRPETPWTARGDAAHRTAGVAAGLYVVAQNILFTLETVFNPAVDFNANLHRNGLSMGDLDRAARVLGVGSGAAAGIFIALVAAACLAAWWAAARPRLGKEAKIIIACAAVAFVSLIPYAAHTYDIVLPEPVFIALLPLSEGLHYMCIIFHEPGHALSHWIFGEPAIPLIDFAQGGGGTYYTGRSYALTAGIYVLMAAGFALLLRKRRYIYAVALAAFAAMHAALVWSGRDLFVSLAAGQAAEIVSGCVFLALALARPDIIKSRADRCVALVAGLHFLGRNVLLFPALYFRASLQREYAVVKSGGDLNRAADVIHAPVQQVAAGMGVFLACCIALAALYVARRRGRVPPGYSA